MPMTSFIVATEGDDTSAVEALLNCTVNVVYDPGTAVMLQTADEV